MEIWKVKNTLFHILFQLLFSILTQSFICIFMAGIMIFRRILFACFRDHCLAVCHCIPFGFLITKAKLNLSLPTPQRGEVLRTKLQDGLFLSQERGCHIQGRLPTISINGFEMPPLIKPWEQGQSAAKREYWALGLKGKDSCNMG